MIYSDAVFCIRKDHVIDGAGCTHQSHVCAYTLCTPHIHPFTCGLTDFEERVSVGIKMKKSLQGTL